MKTNDDKYIDLACPICYEVFGHAPGCPRGAEEDAEDGDYIYDEEDYDYLDDYQEIEDDE